MVVKVEKPVHCTLVGDAMIGKSTIVRALVDHQQPPMPYVATVLETYEGCLDVDGQKHNISVLDSAGQHDYENMRTCSYKDSDVLVLCFSVVDRNSTESIKEFWVPEVNHNHARKKPIILVATQTDLRPDSKDSVGTSEGERLAKEIGADCYLECNAFDKDSVTTVFEQMTASALRYRKRKHRLMRRFFGK